MNHGAQVVDPAGRELTATPPARVAPLGVGVPGVEEPLAKRFDDTVRGPGGHPRCHRRDERPHHEGRREPGQRGVRRRAVHERRDEQTGRHQRGGVGDRPDDAERHLRGHPRQRRAGEAQQAGVDGAGGAGHAATSRPLATRRRNTQYDQAW